MLIWFSMLAVLGVLQLAGNISVLRAINPYYAYDVLVHYPEGWAILGAVFLCTTGAEALYSDLGHCGRKNIRVRSEEHTSELQSLMRISYAVFCLKKKKSS